MQYLHCNHLKKVTKNYVHITKPLSNGDLLLVILSDDQTTLFGSRYDPSCVRRGYAKSAGLC